MAGALEQWMRHIRTRGPSQADIREIDNALGEHVEDLDQDEDLVLLVNG